MTDKIDIEEMTDKIDIEEWVENYLEGLLDRMDLDVDIESMSTDSNETLHIQLAGPDSARAIGREGQMLDALQHMTVSSSIHAGFARQRLLIDVENYRDRREQNVRSDASSTATEVLETGKPYDFEPMSPRERRLVHMVVSEIEGVSTESRGQGNERYVRIIPS
jgi:spoIIIJ-associated protein